MLATRVATHNAIIYSAVQRKFNLHFYSRLSDSTVLNWRKICTILPYQPIAQVTAWERQQTLEQIPGMLICLLCRVRPFFYGRSHLAAYLADGNCWRNSVFGTLGKWTLGPFQFAGLAKKHIAVLSQRIVQLSWLAN